MRKRRINIWIPKFLLEHIMVEADGFFPKETGGSLIGYYTQEQTVIVVTDIIDAGPKAKHAGNSFTPDYSYQEKRIAELYECSGRLYSYLGDWHSHPDGNSSLSYKDETVLKNISIHVPARAPCPIMLILGGVRGKWNMKVWQMKNSKIYAVSIVFSKQDIKSL